MRGDSFELYLEPGSGDWRSGSAAALHAVGRRFESFIAHHFFYHMKTILLCWALVLASILSVVAQSEKVKGKAKDLKRNIEAQQTNTVHGATNAPARSK